MKKKLKLKSGLSHQIYIAVFASVCAVVLIGIFIVLAIASNDSKTIKEALIIMVCIDSIVWLIFFVVRVFLRTNFEVSNKSIVQKRWSKVLWEIDWAEIEKIEFFKMPWYFFLSPNIYKGELVITYKKYGEVPKERKVNLIQRDIKKINVEFHKDIKIY